MYTIISTNLITGETKMETRTNPLKAQDVYDAVIRAAISQGYKIIDAPGIASPWSCCAVLDGKIYFQIDLI